MAVDTLWLSMKYHGSGALRTDKVQNEKNINQKKQTKCLLKTTTTEVKMPQNDSDTLFKRACTSIYLFSPTISTLNTKANPISIGN